MAGPTPMLTLSLPTFSADPPPSWQPLFEAARAADTAGVDRVVVSDHVVFGEDIEAYSNPALGGMAGGRQPTGPDGHWLEPLTVLSAVSAVTTRVRLGTNILLAALRRPMVLAKTAATIDVLSGGRLDLGVGVGWQKEEYDAAGLDFSDRGRLLDHTLGVLQTLWRDQRASFSDELLSFDAIHQMPKPIQPGGVPVWVSGTANRRVAERLARFGSGWIPWGDERGDILAGIPRMRDAVAAAGGDLGAMRIVGTLAPVTGDDGAVDVGATMAPVADMAAAGVTDFGLGYRPTGSFEEMVDQLTPLVAGFRSAAGR